MTLTQPPQMPAIPSVATPTTTDTIGLVFYTALGAAVSNMSNIPIIICSVQKREIERDRDTTMCEKTEPRPSSNKKLVLYTHTHTRVDSFASFYYLFGMQCVVVESFLFFLTLREKYREWESRERIICFKLFYLSNHV